MIKLSPLFTLEEMTVSEVAQRKGWRNDPDEREIKNLQRLAKLLEAVKTVLGGKPILINSAYRCKLVNDAVGSKDTSQHRFGCAADIRVPGMTPDQVVKAVVKSGIEFDQIIKEFDTWTHISVPNTETGKPRKQALIIDKAGTRPFA
jgi:zinc D-Ala-D-Ala carboxypeptidase